MAETLERVITEIALNARTFAFELHPPGDIHFNPPLLRGEMWEPTETEVFNRLLASSRLVFDIGANVGWYALVAASGLKTEGTVVAFEPEPSIAAILARNVERNQLRNVEVVRAAVADHEGELPFVTTDHVGDNHLAMTDRNAATTVVRVTTVDAEQARRGIPVDLVKMDTQGAEHAIFTGMERVLLTQPTKPAIITEFWPLGLKRFGATAQAYLADIEHAGYEPILIDEGVLRPMTFAELRHLARTELDPRDEGFIDLVLIPRGDERRHLIETMMDPGSWYSRLWQFWLRPTARWAQRRGRNVLRRLGVQAGS